MGDNAMVLYVLAVECESKAEYLLGTGCDGQVFGRYMMGKNLLKWGVKDD